jgi:dTDP-4-amino-4,6-dideoxygalactose transaminase
LNNKAKHFVSASQPWVGEDEKRAIGKVLDSGYLGMGPEVLAFEKELEGFIGNDVSVVCLNSGTAALQLACEAIGLGSGDEVLVPSLTFVASFQAVSATGARPVACDVRLSDGLLDLEDAANKLTDNTRAIMPVFYAGYPGDIEAIYAFSEANNLRVIEDAAHAFGSSSDGVLIGGNSDICCFSFDPIKNITSGEGGAVVSRDLDVIKCVREKRELGIQRGSNNQFKVSAQGWRCHMSDLMASIGRVQLAKFEKELKPLRQSLQKSYRHYLQGIQEVELLQTSAEVVPHIIPIRLPINKRQKVRDALYSAGFDTRIHYMPNHLLEYYNQELPCLRTERLFKELLTLPTHPGVTIQHVSEIAGIIKLCLKNF